MSDNYLLYDPDAFGALEIKEDTRDAEILRLRAENEKLRAALKAILNAASRITMEEGSQLYMALNAAKAALDGK